MEDLIQFSPPDYTTHPEIMRPLELELFFYRHGWGDDGDHNDNEEEGVFHDYATLSEFELQSYQDSLLTLLRKEEDRGCCMVAHWVTEDWMENPRLIDGNIMKNLEISGASEPKVLEFYMKLWRQRLHKSLTLNAIFLRKHYPNGNVPNNPLDMIRLYRP